MCIQGLRQDFKVMTYRTGSIWTEPLIPTTDFGKICEKVAGIRSFCFSVPVVKFCKSFENNGTWYTSIFFRQAVKGRLTWSVCCCKLSTSSLSWWWRVCWSRPRTTSTHSVVDPNRLCSDPDPDPGSHVHSDLDPAPEPNRIRINWDPDLT